MKKVVKIVGIIIIVLVILGIMFYTIDKNRARENQRQDKIVSNNNKNVSECVNEEIEEYKRAVQEIDNKVKAELMQ